MVRYLLVGIVQGIAVTAIGNSLLRLFGVEVHRLSSLNGQHSHQRQ